MSIATVRRGGCSLAARQRKRKRKARSTSSYIPLPGETRYLMICRFPMTHWIYRHWTACDVLHVQRPFEWRWLLYQQDLMYLCWKDSGIVEGAQLGAWWKLLHIDLLSEGERRQWDRPAIGTSLSYGHTQFLRIGSFPLTNREILSVRSEFLGLEGIKSLIWD